MYVHGFINVTLLFNKNHEVINLQSPVTLVFIFIVILKHRLINVISQLQQNSQLIAV